MKNLILPFSIAAAFVSFTSEAQNLSPSNPVSCSGNDTLTVQGLSINAPSKAIKASGNCVLVVIGSDVRGATDVIKASGNAEIIIKGSRVAGTSDVIRTSGNATISIQNSSVSGTEATLRAGGRSTIQYYQVSLTGGIRKSGNGSIVEVNSPVDVTAGAAPQTGSVIVGSGTGTGIDVGSDGTIALGTEGTGIGIGSDGAIALGTPGAGIGIGSDGAISLGTGETGIGIGSGGEVSLNTVGTGVNIGSDGSIALGTDGAGIDITSDGSISLGAGDSSIVLDGNFLRLNGGNSQIEVQSEWRNSGSVTLSTQEADTVISQLGGKQQDGEVTLNFSGDILFDFGSADINVDAAAQLRRVAAVVRAKSVGDVTVVGHTDSVGSDGFNQRLSERRALSVIRWFNSNEGIPASVMRARGLGEKSPIAYNVLPDGSDNPTGRAQNRRVELKFSSR